jgi:hypothetical protein
MVRAVLVALLAPLLCFLLGGCGGEGGGPAPNATRCEALPVQQGLSLRNGNVDFTVAVERAEQLHMIPACTTQRPGSSCQLVENKKAGNKSLPVYMPATDKELYACYLRKSTSYFEWGCGGSTEFAAGHQNLKYLMSIESYPEWLGKVSDVPIVKDGINSGRIGMFHVDIGPVRKFGFPKSKDPAVIGRYPAAISVLKERFDLVLVDGRFRVACFLETVRHYVSHKWPSPTILFHDYMGRIGGKTSFYERLVGAKKKVQWYNQSIVEKYAERVENAQSLAAFNIRPIVYKSPELMTELDGDILAAKSSAS